MIDLTPLEYLRNWPKNWNSDDVAAPNSLAIDHAAKWLTEQNVRMAAMPEPNILPDEQGNVVCEWHHAHRTLMIYIDANSVAYLKDWNSESITSRMEEGDIESQEQIDELFKWLEGENEGSEAQ